MANDLHEEIIEMGQVPRMLSPRTASVGNTAAPVQFSPSPNSWMLDSGSGFDLVGRGDVDLDRLPPIEDLPRPLEVNTANSTVILKESVPVQIGTLGIVVKPVLMEDCPSVLSLGKRIVEEGYSFEWHHGRKPVLTAPDGTRTVCKSATSVHTWASGAPALLQPLPAAHLSLHDLLSLRRQAWLTP